MATHKRALAECDICGFEYPYRSMRMNSYGMLTCPTDWEGQYDKKNHPQNKTPDVRDDEFIKNPRPPLYAERNNDWEDDATDWEDETNYWNSV